MTGFQRYLFRNVLRTLLAIVGGLAMIALLTEGLKEIDPILDNRQSLLVYLWVSVLAAPQIISLLMPIALFVATTNALNISHRENEIVVAQASGMSNWGVASPVLRLAVLASILHLGLNLWIQPAAFREMRTTLSDASTDLAASLVREGQFMHLSDGLTTFAREVNGSQMSDLLIADSRNPDEVSTYIAKKGYIAELEGIPAIVMTDGHVEQLNANGVRNLVRFDQSTFDLAPFVADQKAVILKESDRYLPELFFPDMTNFYDHANRQRLLAEGHARIAAPLLNIAMALIAVYAVLGGDFSRRGYSMRIAFASAAAVALRLAAFGTASAAVDNPNFNALQYGLPIAAIVLVSLLHFVKPTRGKRLPGAGRKIRSPAPSTLTESRA
ncbi:MAG: LptF/LptG family permease [Alphaproteobacteria bacterium]|nr:LptF/LptG family permease [Alphaproteobacteria bacterium]